MTDIKAKMRAGFLQYARPTLIRLANASSSEEWEQAIRLWFDEQDRLLWNAYKAGWQSATDFLLEQHNLMLCNIYETEGKTDE